MDEKGFCGLGKTIVNSWGHYNNCERSADEIIKDSPQEDKILYVLAYIAKLLEREPSPDYRLHSEARSVRRAIEEMPLTMLELAGKKCDAEKAGYTTVLNAVTSMIENGAKHLDGASLRALRFLRETCPYADIESVTKDRLMTFNSIGKTRAAKTIKTIDEFLASKK